MGDLGGGGGPRKSNSFDLFLSKSGLATPPITVGLSSIPQHQMAKQLTGNLHELNKQNKK